MARRRLFRVPERSFFLFGPRGVGKTTVLAEQAQWRLHIDLLRQDDYLAFLARPQRLRELCQPLAQGDWVWIDEVQKVPALLDEVHGLIETKGLRFALSGSSARKLRRMGANLLAGRALTRTLAPFSFAELGDDFTLERHLEFGALPMIVADWEHRKDILRSYVSTYLQEEIQQEGHVRKIAPFLRFLEVAALMSAQQVNHSNLAREAGVPRPSVQNYFSILVDTLIGHWLPAFRPRAKVREQERPKFYWFDAGVARAAAGLLNDPLDTEWQGRALETLLFHELRVYNENADRHRRLYFYRLRSGREIDFVVETQRGTRSRPPEVVLIETKNTRRWDWRAAQAMIDLRDSGQVRVTACYGVYRGLDRLGREGVDVLPVHDFLEALHAGRVF